LYEKTSSWQVNVSVLKGPRLEESTSDQWWCYPLPGAKVISPYGRRGGRGHSGVDLKTKPDDEIRAAFDGEVVFSAKYAGYGNLVRILHGNGLETYYSHNSKNLVKVGDRVKAGDVIALTGRTGRATTEHLHFETRINGRTYDPSRFFDHQAHTIRMKAFQKTRNGYVVKK
jgi:murein DD-endopeptidase MepM/ murein hydrolase activator NlpD